MCSITPITGLHYQTFITRLCPSDPLKLTTMQCNIEPRFITTALLCVVLNFVTEKINLSQSMFYKYSIQSYNVSIVCLVNNIGIILQTLNGNF